MHRLHAQQCFLGTNKSYSAIRSVIKSVVSKKNQTVKADTSISNVNNLYFKYCKTKLNIQNFYFFFSKFLSLPVQCFLAPLYFSHPISHLIVWNARKKV